MATKKGGAKKKGLSASQKVGIGIGITAATAAAVGTYFLYGSKNAKQNRKAAKSWMLKAKGEVLDGLEKAKELSEEEYHNLVDKVVKSYKKHASSKELKMYADELKSHWRDIAKMGSAKPARKAAKKATKKTTKKAAKKTTKKAAKKTTKKAAKKTARKK